MQPVFAHQVSEEQAGMSPTVSQTSLEGTCVHKWAMNLPGVGPSPGRETGSVTTVKQNHVQLAPGRDVGPSARYLSIL